MDSYVICSDIHLPEWRNDLFILINGSVLKNKSHLREEEKRMSETQETVSKSDCSIPLGGIAVEERGRKALWFLRFSTPDPVSNIKSLHMQTVRQAPLSQARETDRSLCVCVCHPFLNEPDGWPRN